MLFSMSGCKRMLGTRTSNVRGSISFFHSQLVRAKAWRDFDVDIVVGKAQFFAQRNIGIVWSLSSALKNVRQLHDHLAGKLRPHALQRSDGVQRIEQEVRVDLALQCVEPGFEQQAFLFLEP